MSRHTIGNKRGSVRGAPPGVYMGFGTFFDSEEEEEDALKPIVKFFKLLLSFLCLYAIGYLVYIVLYALSLKE